MRLFLALLFQVLLVPVVLAALPRVAVMPSPGDTRIREVTDLLTAELSKHPDKFELVERAELQRLTQEASIQALNASERPLALARLAKADGLVFMTSDARAGDRPGLALRLTGCADGLIHSSLSFGGTEQRDDAALAKLAAGLLRFPIARLATPDTAPARIISLLGLRSASSAHDPLAPTLNAALAHQLACQPGLTVAERWKLDEVAHERSIAAMEPPALANGTVLVDGSFETKNQIVVVKLRLRQAGAAGERPLSLSGPAQDPAALAYELAKAINLQLDGQPAARLDATAEARQFYELGFWLMSRRLGPESVQAFESAVALGDTSPKTLFDRLCAYGLMICPEENRVLIQSPDRSDLEGFDRLSKSEFEAAFHGMVRLANLLQPLVDTNWKGFDKAGYDKSNNRFTHRAIFALGEQMLEALHARKEHLQLAEEGRVLRGLLRELLAKGNASYGSQFAGDHTLIGHVYETPEEAIAVYRQMLHPKELGNGYSTPGSNLRGHFWRAAKYSSSRPYLIDWTRVDNSRAEQAWTGFIEEMGASDSLLQRTDSLAFSFQRTSDRTVRKRILELYLSLAENRRDELLSPAGQLTFESFAAQWMQLDEGLRPQFQEKYVGVLTTVIERAEWVEASTLDAAWDVALWWSFPENHVKDASSPTWAVRLHAALERFAARATGDPQWEKADKSGLPNSINRLRTELLKDYPSLLTVPMEVKPAIRGAVPIRGWRPEFDADWNKGSAPQDRYRRKGVKDWFDGDRMIWDGSRLLLPMAGPGMVALDPVTLKSETFPAPAITSWVWNMQASDGTLMMYAGDGVYVSEYRRAPGQWRKLETPANEDGWPLRWQVMTHGGSFYLGSRMPTGHPHPQHLLGQYEEGRVSWFVSSNRLPVEHPFDGKKPRNILGLFPGFEGRPTLYVGVNSGGPDDYQIFDLESAKFLGELGSGGRLQQRGDRVLQWSSYDDEARHILAFDQTSETPRLIMRNPKPAKGISPLREGWEKVEPLLDFKQPVFQGDFVAPIGRAGKLWLLKWEKGAATTAKYNPDDLRLVGVDLTSRRTVVVPLRYDVPDAIRRIKGGDDLDMARPRINKYSLVDTPDGLFFAPCGKSDPDAWTYSLAPAVLFIHWGDVDAWINANDPTFFKNDR